MWFWWLLWRCFFEELLILYSLKDIFEQVCYKCDKNYESDEGYTFFKDKKREVAYLQIRCILLILGSYKTFIEKNAHFWTKIPEFVTIIRNSCSSGPGVLKTDQNGPFRPANPCPGLGFHGLEAWISRSKVRVSPVRVISF